MRTDQYHNNMCRSYCFCPVFGAHGKKHQDSLHFPEILNFIDECVTESNFLLIILFKTGYMKPNGFANIIFKNVIRREKEDINYCEEQRQNIMRWKSGMDNIPG